MVLSQPQLAYLYYLELSLTVPKYYSLSESLIKSFETQKSEKTITTKEINKSIKKTSWIYLLGISLVGYIKIHDPRPLLPPNVTANLKSYLQKCSV